MNSNLYKRSLRSVHPSKVFYNKDGQAVKALDKNWQQYIVEEDEEDEMETGYNELDDYYWN